MRKYLLFLSSLCFSVGHAQMVIENDQTTQELINNVLLGDGVEADNIIFNGLPANTVSSQFGYFDATNSNIGISNGIILATGGVSVALGPNDLPSAHVPVPEDEKYNHEPDLAQIMSPAVLKDVAVVEFDFRAQGDTLRFRYVFASEEYNEHTCSSYNDAFGFFISGPGIVGNPNYANQAKNVALIPGTQIPVAINTVNRGVPGEYGTSAICNATGSNWQANQIYFVNNENNASPNATQFDGFTVPFLVEIPVVCGEIYHIKMAIADANDENNDSAVFIEAGSFSSTPPLKAELEILNPDSEGRPLEGCSTYRFTLSRKDSSRSATYYIKPHGWPNAEEIIPGLPDSISLYAMDGKKSFDVEIKNNNQFEGFRNFEIHFLEPDVCSLDTSVTVITTPVMDNPSLAVAYPDSVLLNCIETGSIQVDVSGGMPPYEISWNNTDLTGFNVEVNPDSILSLSANITDFCGVNQQEINIAVIRESYPPLNVLLPGEISYNCVSPVSISPVVQGGFGEYSFEWYQNDELIYSGSHLNQILNSDGDIVLVTGDICSQSVIKNIEVKKQENPLTLSLDPNHSGSCKTNFVFIPELTGGFGDLQYEWRINNNVVSDQPVFIGNILNTSLVSLEVTDACDDKISASTFVYINTDPLNVLMPVDTAICVNEELELDPIVYGGEGMSKYFWNDEPRDIPRYTGVISGNTVLKFRVEDECGNTIEKSCEIEVKKVHADFKFNYEDYARPILNYSTENANYNWFFPNGSTANVFEPLVDFEILQGGYTQLLVSNDIGCEAEAFKIFKPTQRIFLPNAFTPDGDGINDVFKAEGEHVDSFELMIFNRWGKMIFYSDDISIGWNGHGADQGYTGESSVYNYRYVAKDTNGNVEEGTGTVHLLR